MDQDQPQEEPQDLSVGGPNGLPTNAFYHFYRARRDAARIVFPGLSSEEVKKKLWNVWLTMGKREKDAYKRTPRQSFTIAGILEGSKKREPSSPLSDLSAQGQERSPSTLPPRRRFTQASVAEKYAAKKAEQAEAEEEVEVNGHELEKGEENVEEEEVEVEVVDTDEDEKEKENKEDEAPLEFKGEKSGVSRSRSRSGPNPDVENGLSLDGLVKKRIAEEVLKMTERSEKKDVTCMLQGQNVIDLTVEKLLNRDAEVTESASKVARREDQSPEDVKRDILGSLLKSKHGGRGLSALCSQQPHETNKTREREKEMAELLAKAKEESKNEVNRLQQPQQAKGQPLNSSGNENENTSSGSGSGSGSNSDSEGQGQLPIHGDREALPGSALTIAQLTLSKLRPRSVAEQTEEKAEMPEKAWKLGPSPLAATPKGQRRQGGKGQDKAGKGHGH